MPSADWSAVLDDLESRVTAAEAGDLARLDGWTAPAADALPPEQADRARAVLHRQYALLRALDEQQAVVRAALTGLRRRVYRGAAPTARYIDRSA